MLINDSKWAAFIPLRSGSKGLPGKNVLEINSIPLYKYTVDLAIRAGAERIIISTDIESVLNSEHSDKVILLRRPKNLASDSTPMAPVVLHAIEKLKIDGDMLLLQATSPLRNINDVSESLKLLRTKKFNLIISTTPTDSSVLKWGAIDDGLFIPISKVEYCFANRQQLPLLYKPNGSIYAFNSKWFKDNGGFSTPKIGAFVMPSERSVDIDSYQDFLHCSEVLMKVCSS